MACKRSELSGLGVSVHEVVTAHSDVVASILEQLDKLGDRAWRPAQGARHLATSLWAEIQNLGGRLAHTPRVVSLGS